MILQMMACRNCMQGWYPLHAVLSPRWTSTRLICWLNCCMSMSEQLQKQTQPWHNDESNLCCLFTSCCMPSHHPAAKSNFTVPWCCTATCDNNVMEIQKRGPTTLDYSFQACLVIPPRILIDTMIQNWTLENKSYTAAIYNLTWWNVWETTNHFHFLFSHCDNVSLNVAVTV